MFFKRKVSLESLARKLRADAVRRFRTANNWTMRELAERVGGTEAQISLIESYKRGIPDDLFDRMVAVFGTSHAAFYLGEQANYKVVIERKPTIREALDVIAASKDYSYIKTHHINQKPVKKS